MIQLPASMQVFERGWLSSNNILFIDDQQTALVDSGYLSHAPQTMALMQQALGDRTLDLLVNTHLHSDHCGGNASLQRQFGCRTLIPIADTPAVAVWDEEALTYAATGQRCERFSFDGAIQHGDELQLGGMSWQVLSAPGHDPHSMILYCAQEGILISADALWENGFGIIFPELEGESGFAEQAAILQVIRELQPRIVIPGHGAAFSNVDAALARAESRLAYLQTDPRRNARNAVKVMLAFILLELRQLSLAQALSQLGQTRCFISAAGVLGLSAEVLIPQIAAELVAAGAATLDADVLTSSR
ncbi:MBL fold metallo-hydrolase [Undibacterium pigrum]|uniref:Glyoxylase-like metal-dependent hydrolase (Beta-lactamase superfamily II) n=1 Tax=Undibacterium pigrum TaxID=401470 RepID=A0A318J4A2_9BURK|nr:MBL fold metallo-hydrolase [Undibacterium pigrum]PXX38738.1 glyoxylase-like metal-dependent hydrolase (beta-lactamase superfamily II) [Undibacterium pigrum]